MIFFMAGTSDARELGLAIQESGYPVLASVVTAHAARVLEDAGLRVRHGRLDAVEMERILGDVSARMVVDASHPFAEEAHRTAMAAAASRGIPYIRYERTSTDFDAVGGVTQVGDYEQAARLAAQKKGSIMLTTGSKTLRVFTERLLGSPGIRLVARMLPRADNMDKCAELGLPQQDIIAMQGPFSRELNEALYRHYGTTLMITKESGGRGAVDEKVEAALSMGIEVIVITRPSLDFGTSFASQEAVLQEIVRMYPRQLKAGGMQS